MENAISYCLFKDRAVVEVMLRRVVRGDELERIMKSHSEGIRSAQYETGARPPDSWTMH